MKRGYTPFVAYRARNLCSWHVELWEQPWRWWIASEMYSWYSMRVFKVPGFKRLEHVVDWWIYRTHKGHPLDVLPWGVRQNLRDYHLSLKERTVLVHVDIDQETYNKICKRKKK